jgi:hypothetical protein
MDSEKLNIKDIKKKDFTEKENKKNKTGDLFQVSNKVYQTTNVKLGIILFFLYIILNLDIFIENVLSKVFNNVYDHNNDKILAKGLIINGVILALLYMLLDLLNKKNII